MAEQENYNDKTRSKHWLIGALIFVGIALLAPILRLLQLAGVA